MRNSEKTPAGTSARHSERESRDMSKTSHYWQLRNVGTGLADFLVWDGEDEDEARNIMRAHQLSLADLV